MNNFSRLWGIGAAPTCLKHGPGVIKGKWIVGCQIPKKKALDWLVCVRKVLELFTLSRNWKVLGWIVSPESARPQKSKHQKYKKHKGMSDTKS